MPLYLALDTACGQSSVAVLQDTDIISFFREDTPGKQAGMLVPMIERALAEAGVKYAELEAVVSTVGPGSFTGLRIGLTAARMIGFAAGKPVYGVSTLAAVAYAARDEAQKRCAVLNAGKGEVYAQCFHGMTPLDEPRILAPEALPEDFLIVGYQGAVALLTDAASAGRLAVEYPQFRLAPDPLYIRPPDAKLPVI